MLRFSLGALVLAGCAADVLVIPLEPDQRALLVTVGDGFRATDARWTVGSRTATMAFPEASSVAVFRFPQSTFEWRGEGSWFDHLPAAATDDGSCRRCFSIEEVAPLPAYAGDSCLLPPPIEGEAYNGALQRDDLLISELRRSLLLAWPGAQRCQRIALLGAGAAGGFDSTPFYSFFRTGRMIASTESLTPELLSNVDILYVRSAERTYTSTEARALEAWVRAGGGLIALSGFGAAKEPATSNALFLPLGFEFFGPEVDGRVSFVEHPSVRGVITVPLGGGFGVRALDPSLDLSVGSTEHGVAIALALEHGKGRVFAWGDDFATASFFAGDLQVRLFWANVLGWTARR